ncbi:MAG: hypothetical protein RHS_5936 [Robinsoniella sp. RHS]|nr:MAG: hypothetical protein RHS_5936 [Robinsoniella sp. RHS]
MAMDKLLCPWPFVLQKNSLLTKQRVRTLQVQSLCFFVFMIMK